MILKQIPVGSMANFTYIIGDEKTKVAAVVDPSWDLEKVLDTLKVNDMKLQYIINTHTHFDHVLGNEQLAELTDAKIIMHKNSTLDKDITVEDGSTIQVGSLNIKIIHTPGHSKDAICLLIEDKLFTGDTLFVGSCGRIDLPGGNASELYDSLFGRLAKLDERIEIYPGHDYGSKPSSTIGDEKKTNHVLKPRTREEFMLFMRSGD
jgi:glyoxylase-like metal-dependent hydrolase (beta-lactamase superfamily II)